MKFKLTILLIFLTSCTAGQYSSSSSKSFVTKGFAYIYNEKDFNNKILKRKLDNQKFQIALHNTRIGSPIKITNLKTNESIVVKNTKSFQFPEFYKILITQPVANKINLKKDLPLVEIIELKKNKSFVAKKTVIYNEEKKIANKAPIENIKIDNISKDKKKKIKDKREKLFIVIGEFYSKKSAINLKKRITNELINYNIKKLTIITKKTNKISLLSGPYNSINSLKNDYIQLKNFGFEDLEVSY